MTDKTYKQKQQELTELNADGNNSRGNEGEDTGDEARREREAELKKRIEELRKRDPFIYK